MLQKEGNALNTEITNAVSAAGDKVQYDTRVKRILAQKNILAHILVKTVDEFKEAGPEDWTTLEKAVCHPSVLAIGEAGLDRLGPADILLQKEVFVRQILLSESVGKPLVIHCVKAFNELIELKKKYRPQMPWVVHGFRNNLHIACRLMQENIYFSLGERYQPDVLRHVPLECLLAETDESTQDIRMVIGRMAETKNVEVSFLCDRIDENARKIFFRQ